MKYFYEILGLAGCVVFGITCVEYGMTVKTWGYWVCTLSVIAVVISAVNTK